MLALTRRELHLLECGTANDAIGIAESFWQFEMVASFRDDELHGFACSFDRRGELAGLALNSGDRGSGERRRWEFSVYRDGVVRLTPAPSHVGELDILSPLGEPDGVEVVQAAHQYSALHNIGRHAKIFLPLGHQDDSCEMGAG